MDLNKEIKLSELFRRKAKEPKASAGAEPEKAEKTEKPKKAPKERGPLFARKERARKEAKAPRTPKSRKERAPAKAAPELPAIPLMRAFNLQLGEEVRQQKSARLGLAEVLVALLGVLLIGGLGSAYIFMGARASDREAEVEDLRAQLADLEVPPKTPAAGEESALVGEGQARTTSLAGALEGRVAWDRILREISLVLPDEAYLTEIAAATTDAASTTAPAPTVPGAAPATGSTVTLTGSGASQALVAQFLSRLEKIPEFAAVELQSSSFDLEAETYSFSILATVAAGGVQ